MADTDEVSWLERHVEKAVLGATAFIMIVVMLFWVIPSTRKIELAGNSRLGTPAKEALSPDEVDPGLLSRSDGLHRQLKKVDQAFKDPASMRGPEREKLLRECGLTDLNPPDHPAVLAGQFRNPCPSAVHDLVQLVAGRRSGKEVDIASAGGKLTLAELLPLVGPEAPLVWIGNEVVAIPQAVQALVAGGNEYKETTGSHVSVVYPHGKLLGRWKPALEKAGVPASLVFYAVKAERRQRVRGGQWSQPQPVSYARKDQYPLPRLSQRLDGGDTDPALLRRDIATVASTYNQSWIVEPEYYRVFADGKLHLWWRNKPRTRVSNAVPKPDEPSPAVPAERPVPPPGRRQRFSREPDPRYGQGLLPPPLMPDFEELDKLPPEMRRPDSLPPDGPPMPVPGPAQPAALGPAPDALSYPAAVLPLGQQLAGKDGILEAWCHEMNLSVGVEYSYRVQLVLISPLAGRFQDVAKAEDARTVLLTTPWSPWSEPASARSLTQFFVVGGSENPEVVMVDVFTEKLGQTIKMPLSLGRGHPIKGSADAKVVQPDGQIKSEKVDFDTGAVVVDFRLDRAVRLPRMLKPGKTTELVYLDVDGKLRTRTKAADKASELYQKLQKAAASAAGRPGQ